MPTPSYGERERPRCDRGEVYEEARGWVPCEVCKGSGRAVVYLYPRPQGRP